MVAVSANIESMFFQVVVLTDDQPSLRMQWRKDLTSDVVVYQYMRHFSVPQIPLPTHTYALQRTGTDNYEMLLLKLFSRSFIRTTIWVPSPQRENNRGIERTCDTPTERWFHVYLVWGQIRDCPRSLTSRL